MKRTLLVVLVPLWALSGAQAGAVPSRTLLALTAGGLHSGSRLVALEPRTLEPRGGLALPSWAFGREWARSPDGARLALVPKPSETNERLFVIGVRGSLRVVARLPLPDGDVCRLAWPSARKLLVVLTRGGGCYNAVDSARVLVIDPIQARIVAERPFSGRATVVATAPTQDGLALLLGLRGRRSGARLTLVAADGIRSIRLPTLGARPRPLDKSLLGSAIGLAVDRKSARAYLVEAEGRVIEVDLASGAAGVHPLPLRKPAAAAKGITGSIVQALSLRPGVLAITGVRRAAGGRLRPLGLWFLDTRTWRPRLLEPLATGIAVAGTTLLAFQPALDQLDRGIGKIGLRGYTLSGSIRFHALNGRPIAAALAEGRYAYAAGVGGGNTTVVDLRNGRVEAPGPDAISVSPFELLAGASH